MLSFQTASNLVKAGQYDRILVVCSCTYSRASEETDPVAWGVGDAAVAFVVGETPAGYGFLGGHSLHSGATCGAIEYKIELDEHLAPVYRMRTNQTISKKLKDTAEPFLKDCVNAALARAGVGLGDLDFRGVQHPARPGTPAFCARALGIPREKIDQPLPGLRQRRSDPVGLQPPARRPLASQERRPGAALQRRQRVERGRLGDPLGRRRPGSAAGLPDPRGIPRAAGGKPPSARRVAGLTGSPAGPDLWSTSA